jgi:hypothetical protein
MGYAKAKTVVLNNFSPTEHNSHKIRIRCISDRSKSISNFPHYEMTSSEMRHYYPPLQQQQQQQQHQQHYHPMNFPPIPFHPSPTSDNGTIRSKSAVAINQIPRQG